MVSIKQSEVLKYQLQKEVADGRYDVPAKPFENDDHRMYHESNKVLIGVSPKDVVLHLYRSAKPTEPEQDEDDNADA